MAHASSSRSGTYHAPSYPTSIGASQARRRLTALEAQKERRISAFEAARSPNGLDAMDDLSLPSSSSEDEAPSLTPTVVRKHRVKKKAEKVYKPWARNLLQHAETLDLRSGLPEGWEADWSTVATPKGKRCLVATVYSPDGMNSTLLSRVSGRTLATRKTALPIDTLVDCIWDEEMNVLWVLDVVKWRSNWYVNCSHELRSFFLTSRLSELPPQSFDPTPSSLSSPLLLLPLPSLPAPLSSSTLLPFLDAISAPSTHPALIVPPSSLTPSPISIPFVPTGMLLYLSAAQYHSGTSTLSAWVPLDVEAGLEESEGVERMRRLVRGIAPVSMEEE